MKNLVKIFGLIVIIAIAGFSFTTCDNGAFGRGGTDPALDGIWSEWREWRFVPAFSFNNGNFEAFGAPSTRGTFTTSGNNLTLSFTHLRCCCIGLTWHTIAEARSIFQAMGWWDMASFVDRYWIPPQTGTYFISGNTLTLIMRGGSMTLVRNGGGGTGGDRDRPGRQQPQVTQE